MVGCSKDHGHYTLEETDKYYDELYGKEGGLYFYSGNMSVDSFDLKYEQHKLLYSWRFIFHEKFYQKLINNDQTFHYKIIIPEEMFSLLQGAEADFFAFSPFESNGEREYTVTVEVPLEMDVELSDKDIAMLRTLKYTLMIYDKDYNPISSTELSRSSFDYTQYYE